MWLSEEKRKNTDVVEAAVFKASGTSADVLRAANILRVPKSSEDVLVLSCSDGTEIVLGSVGGDAPSGLNDGEIYISTDAAQITVKNNGAVNITGSVSITGTLKVNGVSVP